MDIAIALTIPRMRERAKKTLRFYYEFSMDRPLEADEQIDTGTAISDLLADVLHLVGDTYLYERLAMAMIHYEAEKKGEL